MSLSLPIPAKGNTPPSVTLYQCFDRFFKEEVLENDDAWYAQFLISGEKHTLTRCVKELPTLQSAPTVKKAIDIISTTRCSTYSFKAIFVRWSVPQ